MAMESPCQWQSQMKATSKFQQKLLFFSSKAISHQRLEKVFLSRKQLRRVATEKKTFIKKNLPEIE